jgi:hypothetical protein
MEPFRTPEVPPPLLRPAVKRPASLAGNVRLLPEIGLAVLGALLSLALFQALVRLEEQAASTNFAWHATSQIGAIERTIKILDSRHEGALRGHTGAQWRAPTPIDGPPAHPPEDGT